MSDAISTQNSLVVDGPDTPFQVKKTPIPVPGSEDILVMIRAAALNPADWKVRKYKMLPEHDYPAVLGFDGAGEVVAVGDDVSGWKAGDRA